MKKLEKIGLILFWIGVLWDLINMLVYIYKQADELIGEQFILMLIRLSYSTPFIIIALILFIYSSKIIRNDKYTKSTKAVSN